MVRWEKIIFHLLTLKLGEGLLLFEYYSLIVFYHLLIAFQQILIAVDPSDEIHQLSLRVRLYLKLIQIC